MPVTEDHQRGLYINDMKQPIPHLYGLRDQYRYLFSLYYNAQWVQSLALSHLPVHNIMSPAFCPLDTIIQRHYEISQATNLVFNLQKKLQTEGGK